MIMLDTTIVNIAVPSLVSSFDAGLVAVGWVNSAYLLSYAILLLVAGRLGDRYGPRPMFIAGLAVFTAASLACGVAPTIGWLIAARAVQGIGGGGLASMGMVVLGDVAAPRERGRYYGYFAVAYTTAGASGPALGGFLADHLHWSAIFWLNVPLAVASADHAIPSCGRESPGRKYKRA